MNGQNQGFQMVNVEQSMVIFQGNLEKNRNTFDGILPKHMNTEDFLKVCNGVVAMNPSLLELELISLIDAFLAAARDGLIPGSKDCAIVPYKGKAQYQVMVDGILKKVRQSGVVTSPMAKAVFANDEFNYWMDEDGEHLLYKPCLAGDRGEFVLAFASAKYIENGERVIEIMNKEEVDRVKAASPSSNNSQSPWQKWYDRMAVKSVLHRLSRRLPNSAEIMEMIEREITIAKPTESNVVQISQQQTGKIESQQMSGVGKLNEQQISDLKTLVQLNNTNVNEMFVWVGTQTQRPVERYEDLDQEQLQLILPYLQPKTPQQSA